MSLKKRKSKHILPIKKRTKAKHIPMKKRTVYGNLVKRTCTYCLQTNFLPRGISRCSNCGISPSDCADHLIHCMLCNAANHKDSKDCYLCDFKVGCSERIVCRRKDVVAKEGEKRCIICQEMAISVRPGSCNHFYFCHGCLKEVARASVLKGKTPKCPCCRKKFVHIEAVFTPEA